MKKIALPTKKQAEIIKAHGFSPCVYAVLEDKPDSITVVHRIQAIVRNLRKDVKK